MHLPVQASRKFTFDRLYAQVDWNDFRSVVEATTECLDYWYVLPARELVTNGHYMFAVTALTSLLVDTLSQYEAGGPAGTRRIYEDFLKRHWPEMGQPLPTPIDTLRNGRVVTLDTPASVVYAGIRCGILHEAHVKLFTGICGQSAIVEYHASGFATYADGSDCPVVTLDAQMFFEAVVARLTAYLTELVDPNPSYDDSRLKFKAKFESSYGVTISTSL